MSSETPAALGIFIATIAISLYTMYANHSLYDKMVLHPYSVFKENRWFTLITSGFIHADLMHLMFNMISFYFFAFQLERLIGSENFLIVYFVSLVLSDLPTVYKHKDNYNYRSLGASGAVSAVIFGCILFDPLNTIYVYFIPMPAILFGVLFIAYGYWAGKRGMDYINHSAHNWGAVSGIVLTIILVPESVDYFMYRLF